MLQRILVVYFSIIVVTRVWTVEAMYVMRVECVTVVHWIVVAADEVAADEVAAELSDVSTAHIHCFCLHHMTQIPVP